MVHGHRHREEHPHAARHGGRALAIALALTIGYALVEAIVGLMGQSLALLADAGHMVSDAAALGIALYAFRLGHRRPTAKNTYGFRRAEILAALLNGAALVTIALLVTGEAVQRWRSPSDVRGPEVMVAAVIGLAVNLLAARILRGSAAQSLNTRAAYLHVLGDALGSVGALISGALVTFLGWNRADPVLSVAIAAVLVWGAWRLIRETTGVLMEGAPAGTDVLAIERAIASVPGVESVHDLHVWSITSGVPLLTAHVILRPGSHGVEVAMDVSRLLQREFVIEHCTIQPEAGHDGSGQLVQIAPRRTG